MNTVLSSFVDVAAQAASPRVVRGRISAIENADVRAVSNEGRIVFCQTEIGGGFVCDIEFAGEFLLTAQAESCFILRQANNATQDISSEIIMTL